MLLQYGIVRRTAFRVVLTALTAVVGFCDIHHARLALAHTEFDLSSRAHSLLNAYLLRLIYVICICIV
jgi:hypothetical protein